MKTRTLLVALSVLSASGCLAQRQPAQVGTGPEERRLTADTSVAGPVVDTEADLIRDPWDRSWNRLYMLRSATLGHISRTGSRPADLAEVMAGVGVGLGTDAFGTAIRYTAGAHGFELRSAGPDRTFGTADDLVATPEGLNSGRNRERAPALH